MSTGHLGLLAPAPQVNTSGAPECYPNACLLASRDFAARYAKKDIPLELLQKAYKDNQRFFNQPELVRVAHILVFARRKNDEQHHRQARRAAREIHDIATAGRLSVKEFKQIRGLITKRFKGLRLRGETMTIPQRGRIVATFADAAFALKKPGDISPVVGTRFGYHVIYLVKKTPAKEVTFEAAEAELRDRIYKDAKLTAFDRWAADLERRHRVQLHPERLTGKSGPR